ncbi:transmembrane protein 216 isoform X1 [Onychostruthus taczanowskii]|uniref:transmembrane protein 216 isoform X1 n=1 Tax=Onychostruthus taczanowskii TaxID=356909 RepID=UPI001B808587|nr:transmembrane protein 216 isoform X1 [Onychostruthus taczanowskii]
MAPRGRHHRSSAPLQVLLFLNGWYCATYFLLEAFVFVYKVLLLPYPVSNLVLDVVLLLLYLGIEATRIFFGSKGNLCQRKVPLSLSLALTVPAAVLAVYYLLLQTYSLRLEAFLSAILLLFYGLELLLGFLALLSFSRCCIPGTEGAGAGAARKATGALCKRLTTSSEFITQFQPIQRQI